MSEGGDEVLVDGGLVDEGEEQGGGLLEVMEDAAGLFLNHFVCPVRTWFSARATACG